MTVRLLITGSRTWDNIDYIRSIFTTLGEEICDSITLVSGACPTGADRLGEIVATELGWGVELYPADWNTYGKRAGFVRNSQMVDTNPDLMVAFIHNKSKGASMTVNLGKKKGLPIKVHNWTDYPFTSYSVTEYNILPDAANETDEGTLF